MYKEKNGFKTILSLLLFVTLILAMSSASAADDGVIDDAVMTDQIDNGVDELSFSSDNIIADTESSTPYSVDDATVTEDIEDDDSEPISTPKVASSGEDNLGAGTQDLSSEDNLGAGTQDVTIDLSQEKLYGGDVCNFTISFNETNAGGSVKVTIVDTCVLEDPNPRTFIYNIPVAGGVATASSATSITVNGDQKTFDEVLLWPSFRDEWDDGVQRFPDSVTIAYSGDDNYAPKTVEKSLTVYPYEALMEIDITKGQGAYNDIDYGEPLGLVKFEVYDPFDFDNPYYGGYFNVYIVNGDEVDPDEFNPTVDTDKILNKTRIRVDDGDGSFTYDNIFDEGYYLIGIYFDEVNFPRYNVWEGFNIVREAQTGPFVVLSNGLGYPTLEEAIAAAIEGDNITVIEEGVYKGIQNTGLIIEKSINIAAQEGLNVVFDCENLNNFITVTADKVVVLKDISITNGKSEKGGAVLVKEGGKLACECVNFTNNTANLSGGAIYAENGTHLAIMESKFISNKALEYYVPISGGAVYMGTGFVLITTTNFTNNEAGNSAGAIYLDADKFLIHNCAFNGNKVYDGSAGAIEIGGKDGKIEGCSFDSNEATGYGGAILIQGNNSTVKFCNFTSNKAGENMPGNAIFWYGAQGRVENSTFDSNLGGVSAILWFGNEGNITGSYFKNNDGDPATFNIFNVTELNIEENTFEISNVSIKADGDIYPSGDDAVITGNFNWGVYSSPNDLKVNAKRDFTDIGFVIENFNGCNFTYELKDLLSGYYTLAIENFTDSKNNKFIIETVARADFSVLGNVLVPTEMVITVSDIKYGEDENAVVTLKASDGTLLNGVVKLSIGDQVQNITVENGVGQAKFTNLSANKYVAIAQFDGDDTYASSFATAPIVVSKLKTRIVCKNMTTTAINVTEDGRIGEYFTWTLVDEKGRPLEGKDVSIGFNANVYNRVTNASGQARLQINLQNSGPYTFAIAFLGDENYDGSFEVLKITVNKQKASLSASSQTYKASAKTKTLTATYKTKAGKAIVGKTVKFTVNGKTYSAKTDSSGVAKVNVSLIKAGSYTVEVKAPATNTYAEVTKKVTLKLT